MKRLSFEEWMRRVNYFIKRKTGLSADDLLPYCYFDDYVGEATPEETSTQALKDAGY